jgi:hypothetical protein
VFKKDICLWVEEEEGSREGEREDKEGEEEGGED